MKSLLNARRPRAFALSALVVIALLTSAVAAASFFVQQASAASSVGGIISRSEVIARAQDWFSRGLVYNSSRAPSTLVTDVDGLHKYGPDCSGMVSMAWHVIPGSAGGYNTSNITSVTTPIADRALIQPGDLLLDVGTYNGVYEHHAILFDAWQPDHLHFSYYSFGSTPMRHYDGGSGSTHGPLGSFATGTTLAGHDQSHYKAYQYVNIVWDSHCAKVGSSLALASHLDADLRIPYSTQPGC